MDEHELQEVLVDRWLESGVTLATGERLLLAAWEVMVTWEINNARKEWWFPSIDFLGLDADGRMVAIELKNPIVSAPALAWTQLCQVSVRAAVLAESYQAARLRHVHDECLSGRHGRVLADAPDDLDDRYEALFGVRPKLPAHRTPVRRVIAAPAFGPKVAEIAAEFDARSFAETARLLRSCYSLRSGQLAKEVERLEQLPPAATSLLHGPVQLLTV